MQGTITGGWEFIWAAYLVTWSALIVYTGSLIWRDKKSRREGGA